MNKKTRIGIIGGSGSFASENIFKNILLNYVNIHNIKKDENFPDIILHNLPLKNFNEKAKLSKLNLLQLKASIDLFSYAKCDLIVLACNTFHFFLDELQTYTNVKIYNLLEDIALDINKMKIKKLGIFCSQTSSELKIHQKYINEKTVCVYPELMIQKLINSIIKRIILNKQTLKDLESIKNIKQRLVELGCDKFLFGCTELSLLNIEDSNTIDSSNILVERVVGFIKSR